MYHLIFDYEDTSYTADIASSNKWFAYCDAVGVVMKYLNLEAGTGMWVPKGDCHWQWYNEVPF